MAKHLVISASPRAMGKSVRTAKELVSKLRLRFPSDEVEMLRLSDLDIHYCMGCNTCGENNECYMEDGMVELLAQLETTDHLYIISPVYFAGPPANYKAMLDRFQPLFWSKQGNEPKRPEHLVVIGDGGDPHGFEPLVTCTRSGLAVAGFQLHKVLPFIGSELKPADIGHDLAANLFREDN